MSTCRVDALREMYLILHRCSTHVTNASQSTKQWTSKFRFSFHHRKAIVCHSRIVEDEANKTRSLRSLASLRDRISDYIIGLRIPGEWFQTLAMYERNFELRYFRRSLQLDGAPRSQKRLGISRGGKVSLLDIRLTFFLSPAVFIIFQLIYWLAKNLR